MDDGLQTMATRLQSGGKSFFTLPWDKDGIGKIVSKDGKENYIPKALMSGCCPFYLPMQFSEKNGALIAYYEDTEYMPIRDYLGEIIKQERAILKAVVRLLKDLTKGREEAEDFLLAKNFARLDMDLIYIESKTERLAVAFFPEKEEKLYGLRLKELLQELEREYPEYNIGFLLQKFDEESGKRHLGTKGFLRIFSRWEGELS